jgi:hypothetical protein
MRALPRLWIWAGAYWIMFAIRVPIGLLLGPLIGKALDKKKKVMLGNLIRNLSNINLKDKKLYLNI